MELGFIAQYAWSGLLLGVIYAMVAVGFTLFFGVLDVINFAHGDVLTLGAFAGLASYLGLKELGIDSYYVLLPTVVFVAVVTMACLGALIARFLVLPLRESPPFIILLITLMAGTAIRESIRLFYPSGSSSQSFPNLLPSNSYSFGDFILRLDSLILVMGGILVIYLVNLLINRTKLGLAIRAVSQDSETAQVMGINFRKIVLLTFALGSALAALAGVMNGLYYGEINYGGGLLLGIIGFSAAVVGGLGSIYGAILGGFLFAAIQVLGVVALPFASAYKDVVAFAMVIILIGFKPTGLISEKASERV